MEEIKYDLRIRGALCLLLVKTQRLLHGKKRQDSTTYCVVNCTENIRTHKWLGGDTNARHIMQTGT